MARMARIGRLLPLRVAGNLHSGGGSTGPPTFRMRKNSWILVLSWLAIWPCFGQLDAASQPRFAVDVWGTDQGLPGMEVVALSQTRDGYLWAGTLYGLARFDGLRFTTYNEANTPGLKSSPIIKLFEDSHTNLWIATESAGIFLVQNGRVQSVDLGRSRTGRLMTIAEDATGAVWLYTRDGQIARFRGGKVEVWAGATAASQNNRGTIIESEGLLWIGTDFTLTAWRPAAGLKPGELPATVYPPQFVGGLDALVASKRSGFWLLAGGRIQKWNRDHLELFAGYPWRAPVGAACEDLDGNLIVGTVGEGIFWFNRSGAHVQLTSADGGLSHNTILSLCMDRQGDLWAGTDGGGLNRLKPQVFEVLDSSRGATVESVCEAEGGTLWVGYNGDRIDRWQDGALLQFTNTQGLFDAHVRSVLAGAERQVWAGTFERGLLQLQNGLFLEAAAAGFLRGSEIAVLYQDREKRLWVGTANGVAMWNGQAWDKAASGFGTNSVRAIAQDRQGDLWLGTEGAGIGRLHEGRFSVFGKTDGLPSENVRSLYVDAKGAVWVGTASGLARFADGHWGSYATCPGLAGLSVAYVLEDPQGFLWIGSNAGIKRVRRSELEEYAARSGESVLVRSYGKPDGLPTGECSQGTQPAACRTREGELWFATIQGLAGVRPSSLRSNPNPPAVVIEAVYVNGKLQGSNSIRAPAPRSVTLPARSESLEIHFTTLNLSAPDKGLFRYYLEGHERTWTERPGNERWVRYPKLPHGQYQFRLKACNEDGVWNQTPVSLAITVLPPFWQTWWFVTASTLCLVGIIAGSVHYVSTQKLQRQLVALRHQEALERERARIARDLHDELGANLTQVALLGELAEADKTLPAEVEAHARQISQTARETTRALDEIVWTVNPSNDTLEGLMNYVCKYAQEYLALAGLRYRLDVPTQLPTAPISPELRHNVFLAAKEAVNNVVKHSKATEAWLRLVLEPGAFVLQIEDNGQGLLPAAAEKGRNGLRNMRKRMQDVGGGFEVGPGVGGGTRVSLRAPLNSVDGKA